MSFFRIYIYLKLKYFLLSLIQNKRKTQIKIQNLLNKYTQKKYTILTGQLRVGFYLILKYLKEKNPQKKEIILNSYNLAEMANICKNLNLKIVFPKLNENLFISSTDLKRKINKNTLAVIITNIFNTRIDIIKIKQICKKKKIKLIEDNAIYFSNYSIVANKKRVYSGSFGDYSLHSFNIMKNISGMYGGSVSTNDKFFNDYSIKKLKFFNNFPRFKFFKQCIIYFILKILSINFLYKIFFIKIVNWSHKENNKFFLSMFYPSLNFKKKYFDNNFFARINTISREMIFFQLQNKQNIDFNHKIKKNNNLYYEKLLEKYKNKNLRIIKIKDKNFQNFNDYPVILKNKKIKKPLVNYLLSKGIEIKTIQYSDCQKIFKGTNKYNLETYENRIICLPNHIKIKKDYIDYIIYNINNFFIKKK